MQDRKRLEEALGHESAVATQTSDLDTLFELAREGEDVTGDLEREMNQFRKKLDKRACCWPVRTTGVAPSW